MNIEVFLNDQHPDGEKKKLRIKITDNFVLLQPDGYGDHCSKEGEGFPIAFEWFEGSPRLIVWGNINDEEHTHIVYMEDAKEIKREHIVRVICHDDDEIRSKDLRNKYLLGFERKSKETTYCEDDFINWVYEVFLEGYTGGKPKPLPTFEEAKKIAENHNYTVERIS